MYTSIDSHFAFKRLYILDLFGVDPFKPKLAHLALLDWASFDLQDQLLANHRVEYRGLMKLQHNSYGLRITYSDKSLVKIENNPEFSYPTPQISINWTKHPRLVVRIARTLN